MKMKINVLVIVLMSVIQTLCAQETLFRKDAIRPITQLKFLGLSNVNVVYDSSTFIKIKCSGYYNCLDCIEINDNTLTIRDTVGMGNYEVHVVKSRIMSVTTDQRASVTYPDGATAFDYTSSSGLWNFIAEMNNIDESLFSNRKSCADSTIGTPTSTNDKKRKKRQSVNVSSRTDFDFLWGFTNWGDAWYSGLSKMDGAYNLNTSFSSYQIAENFAVVSRKHWQVKVGIGYESDVYKFSNPYVQMGTDGSFSTVDASAIDGVCGVAGTNLNSWSTRFVARYVTLPISIRYKDFGFLHSWGISLGVVPGLSFNSRHTGLKHELDQKSQHYQDVESESKFINPYKLDVRLTVQGDGLGVFLQVPLVPMFIDSDVKVYPIKIGFML